MARLIVIGDIHGCSGELRELLRRVEPRPGDRVIAVGDFVSKGPDVAGAVELFVQRGYEAVLGNNEDKFLAAAARSAEEVSAANGEVGSREDLRRWLEALPTQIDVPEHGVTVVHAGLAPPAVEATWDDGERREARLRLRYLRKNDHDAWVRVRKGDEREGDVFWTALWHESITVVYGHTPVAQPAIASNSVGIDTGCVYGGALTAAVFEHGSTRPAIVSVPALRKYAERK